MQRRAVPIHYALVAAPLAVLGFLCVSAVPDAALVSPAKTTRAPIPPSATATPGRCVEEDGFTERFETGWASNWYLGPGFQIATAGAGKALHADGASSSIATYLLGDYWTDLSFAFNMQLKAGELWASFRYNSNSGSYEYDRILGKATERYYVEFTSSYAVLGKTIEGSDSPLTTASTVFNPNQSYAIKVLARGGALSVYVNGALLLASTDSRPVPSGSIALEAKSNARVSLDDIQVVAMVPCEHTWKRTATFPIGGDINVIAVDPKNSQTVYAGTEHMGIFKSTDAGLTWTEVGYAGDIARLGKTDNIAIALSNPAIVYSSWGPEVDKSIDGGLHWTRTGLLNAGARINGLTVSPNDPNVVYAALGGGAPRAAADGIYRSSDGGASWTRLGLTSASLSVAVPASAPDTVYAGVADGIYKSTNRGTSWTKVYGGAARASGARPAGVPSLAVNSVWPHTIFAVADRTVRSMDGGATWTTLRIGGEQIVVSPSNPDVVYLREGPNIFTSANRGDTWNAAPPWSVNASDLKTIAVDSSNAAKIYAGSWGQGIFLSQDGGTTWSAPALRSIPADLGAAIVTDPTDAATVYVGTARGEVYVSHDKGGTWTRLVTLGTGQAPRSLITGLLVNPLDPAVIYASSVEGVYKSEDSGASWRAVRDGLSDPRVISLALDPVNPRTLYAGTGNSRPRNTFEGTGIFSSTNGGESWSRIQGFPNAPVPAIVISPLAPDVIYAAVMDVGVYKSVNGGASWSQVNSGLEDDCLYALAIDPTDPDIVYAGTAGNYCTTPGNKPENVYKTTSGGTSWDVVLKGENPLDYIEAIAVSPSNPRNVYVAYHSEKVWFSSDAGTTWRRADKGVVRHGAHLYLWAMAFDAKGRSLYMTSCGLGVLRNDTQAAER